MQTFYLVLGCSLPRRVSACICHCACFMQKQCHAVCAHYKGHNQITSGLLETPHLFVCCILSNQAWRNDTSWELPCLWLPKLDVYGSGLVPHAGLQIFLFSERGASLTEVSQCAVCGQSKPSAEITVKYGQRSCRFCFSFYNRFLRKPIKFRCMGEGKSSTVSISAWLFYICASIKRLLLASAAPDVNLHKWIRHGIPLNRIWQVHWQQASWTPLLRHSTFWTFGTPSDILKGPCDPI